MEAAIPDARENRSPQPVRVLAWSYLRVAVTPVPFFHVFKWRFENSAIFNSHFFIRPELARRAANGRRYWARCCSSQTMRTATSAGLTPEIREAWPMETGRMRESFSRASCFRAGMAA